MIELSVPVAQQALVELLSAALGDDVHVSFGRPGKLPKQRRLAYVLPARNWRLAAGEQHRIESYDLAVRVECFAPGESSAADADTARWEVIEQVHEALHASDLYGYETKGLDLNVDDSTLTLYDKGWVAEAVVTAGVERRVNP